MAIKQEYLVLVLLLATRALCYQYGDDVAQLQLETGGIRASCTTSQLQCMDGKCLDVEQVCDGTNDCVGGEDEQDDLCACSEPDAFRCSPTQCVEKNYVCNNISDCKNGLDERNCTFSCSATQFACVRSQQCVSAELRCDGMEDCNEGEDELDCADSPAEMCPADEFRCTSSASCVPQAKLCDGSLDCDDGSDERNCRISKPSCAVDQFTCKADGNDAAICIALQRRCDGFHDCPQSDDEVNCTASVPVLDATQIDSKPTFACDKATEFHCTYTDTCVSKAAQCDGRSDCPNGEDELKCDHLGESDPCSPSNLDKCEHLCVPVANTSQSSRPRYRCGCKPGFRLAGPYACADINECAADVSPCSHKCENTISSFKCSCAPQYTLGADQRTCVATDSAAKFLLAISGDQLIARNLDSVSGKTDPLFRQNLNASTAFDIDVSLQFVFWATRKQGNLPAGLYMSDWSVQRDAQQLKSRRLQFTWKLAQANSMGGSAEATRKNVAAFVDSLQGNSSGGSQVVLYEDAQAEIVAVAYDWLHNLLFWADKHYRHIAVVSLRSGRMHVLTNTLRNPRALAVDPMSGSIYVTDGADDSASILSFAMDGSDSVSILDSNRISSPATLTIDYASRRLLYIDSKRAFIGACSLGVPASQVGSTCHLLYTFPASTDVQADVQMSTFEDKLYWTSRQDVMSCERSACSSTLNTIPSFGSLRTLRVVHPLRQPTNPVSSNSGCAALGHCPLCLPRRPLADTPQGTCVCNDSERFVQGSTPFTGQCVTDTPESADTAATTSSVDADRGSVQSSTGVFDVGRLAVVIGSLLGIVVVAILIAVLVYRNYSLRNSKSMSMNFENPAYAKSFSIPMPRFGDCGSGSAIDAATTESVCVDDDTKIEEDEMDADADRGSNASFSLNSSPRRQGNLKSDPSETQCLTDGADVGTADV